MKFKKVITLLVILIILCLIVFLAEMRVWTVFTDDEEEKLKLFPKFDTQLAATIEIVCPERDVKLTKKQGKWVVSTADNYPANPEDVDELLTKVTEFTTEDIISKNPEKHSIFKVDTTGIEVKIIDEKEDTLAHFRVGKLGADYSSTYLRKEGSPEVLLIDDFLTPIFDRSSEDWRDKTIFNFDSNLVKNLTLEKEDEKICLEKKQEQWYITYPESIKAKNTVVHSIISTFANLDADEFSKETDLTKLKLNDKPLSKISAVLEGEITNVLLLGEENDRAQVHVKKEDEPTIFLISKYCANNLFKDVDELKEEEKEETTETVE